MKLIINSDDGGVQYPLDDSGYVRVDVRDYDWIRIYTKDGHIIVGLPVNEEGGVKSSPNENNITS